MTIPSSDLEFTRTGRAFDTDQLQQLLHRVPELTDVIVIAHGWSNSKAEARQLCGAFLESAHLVIEHGMVDGFTARRLEAVHVYWPSKRYDAGDMLPGSAAAPPDPNLGALLRVLDRLTDDPERLPDEAAQATAGSEDSIAALRRAHLDEAQRLAGALESDAGSRRQFLSHLRAILDPIDAHPDDGSVEFFTRDAEELFAALRQPVDAPLAPRVNAAGTVPAPAANRIRDPGDTFVAAGRRLASYAAYYDMKHRAALVGRAGLAQVLLRMRDRKPDLRLHLIGHSFGGLLVTAAANALPAETADVTLCLLQAACSHLGFAAAEDRPSTDARGARAPRGAGSYRGLVAERRVSGPIIVTHTRNDRAVGIAHPLASRLSGSGGPASDESDPYGGMARNGAQHTPEAVRGTLQAVGYGYTFAKGKLYNLRADAYVTDHADVTGVQVAYAALHAMRVAGAPPVLAPIDMPVGDRFARVSVPRELNDDEKRRKWGLPPVAEKDVRGPYIVELNAQFAGGLAGAAAEFLALCETYAPHLVTAPPDDGAGVDLRALRIAKSYYRCLLAESEWRAILRADEARALSNGGDQPRAPGGAGPNRPNQRAIYRLWPDFPIVAHTDHSVATIKADAARRSFAADGVGIVWAVIDSGIQADHPHFGPPVADDDRYGQMSAADQALERQKRAGHLLQSDDVRDLHRCFANVYEEVGGIPVDRGPIPSPDIQPPLTDPAAGEADRQKHVAERKELVARHRRHALRDDFGHGTHVAGIIAGEAPNNVEICALERQYKIDDDGTKLTQTFERRPVAKPAQADPNGQPLRGVAPRCKLISLRVLDQNGRGRASQVIQALEYIRESLNDNPKLLRVHGINLSVGYEFDAEMFACGQSPLCTEVDRLVQEGVVVVAAAGNTGYGTIAASVGTSKVGLSNTINDPGNAALAITVGATHRDMPHLYGVSYFSSKGPTGDGRLKPDLVAPGERITSCAAGTKLQEAHVADGAQPGVAYYIDDSGTSMAAPHVSGAIAAFLSIRREFIGKPLDVKRIFTESATPLGRERYFEGHGLVDLMRAIQSV